MLHRKVPDVRSVPVRRDVMWHRRPRRARRPTVPRRRLATSHPHTNRPHRHAGNARRRPVDRPRRCLNRARRRTRRRRRGDDRAARKEENQSFPTDVSSRRTGWAGLIPRYLPRTSRRAARSSTCPRLTGRFSRRTNWICAAHKQLCAAHTQLCAIGSLLFAAVTAVGTAAARRRKPRTHRNFAEAERPVTPGPGAFSDGRPAGPTSPARSAAWRWVEAAVE